MLENAFNDPETDPDPQFTEFLTWALPQLDQGLHSDTTPMDDNECLMPSRFLAVVNGDDWSQEEAAHLETCESCRRYAGQVAETCCPNDERAKQRLLLQPTVAKHSRRTWMATLFVPGGVAAIVLIGSLAYYFSAKTAADNHVFARVLSQVDFREFTQPEVRNDDFMHLITGRSYQLVVSHPEPWSDQWLLHVTSKTATLVRRAPKNRNLEYSFNVNADWASEDTRFEYFAVVTADSTPPGWNANGATPIDVTSLFRAGDFRELQKLRAADEQCRAAERIFDSVLKRQFGSTPFKTLVLLGESENRS